MNSVWKPRFIFKYDCKKYAFSLLNECSKELDIHLPVSSKTDHPSKGCALE